MNNFENSWKWNENDHKLHNIENGQELNDFENR